MVILGARFLPVFILRNRRAGMKHRMRTMLMLKTSSAQLP